jgi:sorbitol-specific phosphotransferase system component IIBC
MGGYGFAITASIEVVEDRDCVCPLSEAKAIVITEEGTGRCCIYPYKDVDRANKISAPWSSCHVVYDMAGTEYRAGGAGFAR